MSPHSSPSDPRSVNNNTRTDKYPLRALITGFGPFSVYTKNPSWLAVKPLQDKVLYFQPSGFSELHFDEGNGGSPRLRDSSVHIIVLEFPVKYAAVLKIVPGLHHNLPTLPRIEETGIEPLRLADKFGIVLHVGVSGSSTVLRVEKLAHKYGYVKPDVDGQTAPEVHTPRSPDHPVPNQGVQHGFGYGYEQFPEEIASNIDTGALVRDMQDRGIKHIHESFDAGHYLCDFIYYCSLAESRRQILVSEQQPHQIPVLFLHCPPVDKLSTSQVTKAIEELIIWMCQDIQATVHDK